MVCADLIEHPNERLAGDQEFKDFDDSSPTAAKRPPLKASAAPAAPAPAPIATSAGSGSGGNSKCPEEEVLFVRKKPAAPPAVEDHDDPYARPVATQSMIDEDVPAVSPDTATASSKVAEEAPPPINNRDRCSDEETEDAYSPKTAAAAATVAPSTGVVMEPAAPVSTSVSTSAAAAAAASASETAAGHMMLHTATKRIRDTARANAKAVAAFTVQSVSAPSTNRKAIPESDADSDADAATATARVSVAAPAAQSENSNSESIPSSQPDEAGVESIAPPPASPSPVPTVLTEAPRTPATISVPVAVNRAGKGPVLQLSILPDLQPPAPSPPAGPRTSHTSAQRQFAVASAAQTTAAADSAFSRVTVVTPAAGPRTTPPRPKSHRQHASGAGPSGAARPLALTYTASSPAAAAAAPTDSAAGNTRAATKKRNVITVDE